MRINGSLSLREKLAKATGLTEKPSCRYTGIILEAERSL